MFSLFIIIFFIALGVITGFYQKNNKQVHIFFSFLTMILIYILLFVLGAELGKNKDIFMQLPVLGVVSFFIALFGSIGSVVLVLCIQGYYSSNEKKYISESKDTSINSIITTIKILFCFVVGILLSRFELTPAWIYGEKYTEYLLWCVVFSVGVGLGADIKLFIMVRKEFYMLFAIPFFIVLGTVFGAAVVGILFPQFSIKETITAGCGLGYYSLSSILVRETGNTSLAAITLLSNVFRELLGVMSAPFLARYIGIISPVAVGAATSMDTSLPVIAQFCGEKVAIISVFSGIVLTILVPFLVSFCLYL